MKIGICNIYSWHPHLRYTAEIMSQLNKSGHTCVPFLCGGMQTPCYDKFINDSNLLNCLKCQIKQSYYLGALPEIGRRGSSKKGLNVGFESTVASIVRAYEKEHLNSGDAIRIRDNLKLSIDTFYSNFNRWLDLEKIDTCILFNGRFDLTAAALEALRQRNIMCITHERAWFGMGLNLNLNQSCMSLKKYHFEERSVKYSRKVKHSLARAILEPRFSKHRNSNEWRTFKGDIKAETHNFSSDKLNVLYLPSSPSEYMFERDWVSPFQDLTYNLKVLSEKFSKDNLIVKGHPIWSQNIKELKSNNIDDVCAELAKDYGFKYFRSNSNIDTNSMILHSDLIVTSGSSSALQAGFLGKPVLNLGNCEYSKSDFVVNISSEDELEKFSVEELETTPSEQISKTLDFTYSFSMEKMHFSDKTYLKTSAQPSFVKEEFFANMLDVNFLTSDYEPSFMLENNAYLQLINEGKRLKIKDFLGEEICNV